jgi:hypothetical protein
MGLLAPLFLVGLAGLAVPVFIHLIQREKKRVVQFPSGAGAFTTGRCCCSAWLPWRSWCWPSHGRISCGPSAR